MYTCSIPFSKKHHLKDFNKIRNSYFCKAVLGDLLQKEVINISHYGMPTNNSICIGSQWEQLDYALLTAPGNAIYLVHPKLNLNNTFALDNINITLTPHGCGVKMNNSADKIEYLDKNTLKVGNNIFSLGNSVNIGIDVSVRTNGMNEEELDTYILNILKQCPGTVYGKLKQRYAKTKSGDFEFIKEN